MWVLVSWPFQCKIVVKRRYTVKSGEFEVLRTRGFLLKHRKFQLYGGRHKNIYTPTMIINFSPSNIKLWSIKRSNCLEVSYNVWLFNNQYFTVMNLCLYPSCQSALNKLTWLMLIGFYQKRKQRLHVCTYPTCQLDLGVKYHVNKDILK